MHIYIIIWLLKIVIIFIPKCNYYLKNWKYIYIYIRIYLNCTRLHLQLHWKNYISPLEKIEDAYIYIYIYYNLIVKNQIIIYIHIEMQLLSQKLEIYIYIPIIYILTELQLLSRLLETRDYVQIVTSLSLLVSPITLLTIIFFRCKKYKIYIIWLLKIIFIRSEIQLLSRKLEIYIYIRTELQLSMNLSCQSLQFITNNYISPLQKIQYT